MAVRLITEYEGGEVSRQTVVGQPALPPERVAFHPRDVARLTGLEIKPAEMKRLIRELGFSIEDAGEAWYLDVPSWRFDMEQSADIVEEIARLIGFDSLPMASLPVPEGGLKSVLTPMQARIRTSRRVMASRGFLEAVTWSFMPKAQAKLFGGGSAALEVANPVASELNQMRPSILANLSVAAQKGFDRGEREMRLFEAGPIFLGDGPKDQRNVIAAIVRPVAGRYWHGNPSAYDAMAAKADLFALLSAIDQPPERFQIDAPRQAHWHPGQAACLKLGPKVTIAHFGALHPGVLKELDVDGPVFGFELNLNAIPQMRSKMGKTKPVFERADLTPIRRDFAFVVDEAVTAGDIVKAATGADKALIAGAEVFDVYRGKGIDEGKKSVAIELTIQPRGETLKDKQIDAIAEAVVAAVAKGTGGVLRG